MRLYEDNIGLHFFADLIEGDSLSQSIFNRLFRGDWSQMSFAFTTESDKWEYAKSLEDKDLRTVLKIKELFDISIVTYPAYPDTTAKILQEKKSERSQAPASELGDPYIPDARTAAAYARLQALDERRLAREKTAERERQYEKLGLMIERNNASIAHAKVLGARPVSAERQRQINADYFRAGGTIRRLQAVIEHEKAKQLDAIYN